jgi:hypothetical protein
VRACMQNLSCGLPSLAHLMTRQLDWTCNLFSSFGLLCLASILWRAGAGSLGLCGLNKPPTSAGTNSLISSIDAGTQRHAMPAITCLTAGRCVSIMQGYGSGAEPTTTSICHEIDRSLPHRASHGRSRRRRRRILTSAPPHQCGSDHLRSSYSPFHATPMYPGRPIQPYSCRSKRRLLPARVPGRGKRTRCSLGARSFTSCPQLDNPRDKHKTHRGTPKR